MFFAHLREEPKRTLRRDLFGVAKLFAVDLSSVFGPASMVLWHLGLREKGWLVLSLAEPLATPTGPVTVPAKPVTVPVTAKLNAQTLGSNQPQESDPALRSPRTPAQPVRSGPPWHALFRVLQYLCWAGVMMGCNLWTMVKETLPTTQADSTYVMLMFLAFPLFLIGLVVFGLLSLVVKR
jgi:hypothetical protein